MYYAEIGKIVEAGLERDNEKVRSFSLLLAKKMEADGETRGSESINKVLNRKKSGRATLDSLAPLPVDQESRMIIVDVDYDPQAGDLILSEPVRLKLQDFMDTIQHKRVMDDLGLEFSQSLLLYGYPGSVIEMPRPGIPEIKQMMDLLPDFLDTSHIKENQWKKIYQSMEGLSYSDIRNITNNLSKKAVLNENKVLEIESVIAEVYLFRMHGDYTKEDMALFMLDCAVPKNRIVSYTGLSRRKIDQLEGSVKDHE